MSDRTQGSVRTATEGADGAPGERLPPSATQAIPTTGAQRAAGGSSAGTPASPAAAATPAAAAAPAVPGTSTAPAASDAPAASSTATGTKTRARGTGKAGGRGPRRARLQLRHIDTWSALKISLVLSIALFFIWMVAVGLLYGVLSALGVFHTLNDLFGQLGSASGSSAGGDVITPGVVFGGAAIVGAINVVLLTALCTVGTFIYNLCADLVGGLEVTLSERD